MLANFDTLETAIATLAEYVDYLKKENKMQKSEIENLKSTIEERDEEIALLQEDVRNKDIKANEAAESNVAYEKRIEGMLARVRAMTPEKNTNSTLEF